MTLAQLHTTLRNMLPVEVRLHLQVGLQSCWDGHDPTVKRETDLALQLEFDAFASLDGVSAHVEGTTADEVIERFRAVVLPALGLGPDVPAVSERLNALDCDLENVAEDFRPGSPKFGA